MGSNRWSPGRSPNILARSGPSRYSTLPARWRTRAAIPDGIRSPITMSGRAWTGVLTRIPASLLHKLGNTLAPGTRSTIQNSAMNATIPRRCHPRGRRRKANHRRIPLAPTGKRTLASDTVYTQNMRRPWPSMDQSSTRPVGIDGNRMNDATLAAIPASWASPAPGDADRSRAYRMPSRTCSLRHSGNGGGGRDFPQGRLEGRAGSVQSATASRKERNRPLNRSGCSMLGRCAVPAISAVRASGNVRARYAYRDRI